MYLKNLSNLFIYVALFFYTYYFYVGIASPTPALGDSFDYHIPISMSIIDGTFLNLNQAKLPQWFYPGSSEAINSIFIVTKIPLTLSNYFAAIVLFFVLWKLALIFKLNYYYAVIFALTFSTMTVIMRWLNSISVDIWFAVFFSLAIILLERPKPKYLYFIKLGIILGMFIGTKYGAIFYTLILIFYIFKILKLKQNLLNFTINIFLFFIPLTILGLSWYFRNLMITGNPIYPIDFLGLNSKVIFTDYFFNVAINYPMQIVNAFYSEYHLWILSVPIAICYLFYKRNIIDIMLRRVILIGLMSFLIFLIHPSSYQPEIMVSSMRYSYLAFIFCILGMFILAKKYNKEKELSIFAIITSISTLSIPYYPKLIFIYLPLGLVINFFINRFINIKNTT